MKHQSRILIPIVFLILFFTGAVNAQSGRFGIGIIAGEPTGLSLKYKLSENNAIDAAAAWSFLKEAAFHVHADYLFHDYGLITINKGKLPFYYGIGARLKLSEKSRAGVRVPLGLAYEFANSPVDIFLEVVPLLDLAPSTELNLNGAVGVRFYFE